MPPVPNDPGQIPAPWWGPDGDLQGLERELHRELPPDHPLHGARARAAARCEACDDVLFSLTGQPFRWAVVHPTWSGHQEQLPWPRTSPLAHLNDLFTRHDCTSGP
ncbi:hypothetical protein [Streptomyces sp. NPDC018045]|uniref:hypothetical protein n=1 Tax=Streptomyces sp. NPDC018045 TaxID=3365037 RepID=UPI00379E9AFD